MEESLGPRLLRADAFGHPVAALVLRETHISWVILTGKYAYKIKKPLNLGFLDFSTLAARRHFCEEEVRLNRRFAPEIYLSVVPVADTAAGPVIDGDGEVIDYAVRMRQFDDRALLAAIADRSGLDATLLRKLAHEMAEVHARLAAERPRSGPGTPAVFAGAMRQNFAQLDELQLPEALTGRLSRVAEWSERRYAELADRMRCRLRDGFVKDCHGDLHLGNIAVIDGEIRFFDCIEFDPAFRVMDTIAELAFTTMDLSARGLPEAAARLINDYLEYRPDHAGLALLDFYCCYYAVVRAKVNLLRYPEAPPIGDTLETAGHYLAQADGYAQPRLRFVVLMHGVSGSGKSTVAAELAVLTGAIRLRSDVVRKSLFGLAPEASSASELASGLYSREATERTFAELLRLAGEALNAGFGVIVDATFLHADTRAPFARLAAEAGCRWRIVACEAEREVLETRLDERRCDEHNVSEADAEIMCRQLEQLQPFTDGERAAVWRVDTVASSAREIAETIADRLATGAFDARDAGS